MRKIYSVLSFSALLGMAASCSDVLENDSLTTDAIERVVNQEFVPGQLLIKYRTANQGSRISQDLLAMIQASVVEEIKTPTMVDALARKGGASGDLLLVESKLGTLEAIERLKNMPEVEYAEPNWIYQHAATSNDPYFTNGSLWGMGAGVSSFGSGANTAWAAGKTGSNTVYVGIIDEGYMYTHEDLAPNAGVNPGEIANNGVDDDGNGYVDDVYGWDFAGNNNTVFDGTADDHGTHVAGTIGGVGGNGKGVAGVVWNVKLLSAKFLGSRGGTTANAIKAVDYFTDLKNSQGLNIVATNNSWGGGGYSQALKDAIDRANAAGILFIAAAGNSGTNNDATASYPSGYTSENIIAVASITSTGDLSSFSQYGANTVDIGAPGSGIWSTVPKASGKGKTATIGSGYASYNGTSMATPHVTGAAALYASENPGASAAQIKAAILGSATPTPSLAGTTVTGGRLNVSGF
ncbi:S8 family peptidase [Algoriphagus sanaruensis]|uniref:Peptidase S8 n=1 Tax=Algoriphagus sanaruensis TaxID=1727163 RepID=A0A142EQD7_9BACT|nr:S8 family peptidase [Algoriphagus sanaruensis]AMQ57342.1 peptidase S8 [Algoriphagus sanaruensis]